MKIKVEKFNILIYGKSTEVLYIPKENISVLNGTFVEHKTKYDRYYPTEISECIDKYYKCCNVYNKIPDNSKLDEIIKDYKKFCQIIEITSIEYNHLISSLEMEHSAEIELNNRRNEIKKICSNINGGETEL